MEDSPEYLGRFEGFGSFGVIIVMLSRGRFGAGAEKACAAPSTLPHSDAAASAGSSPILPPRGSLRASTRQSVTASERVRLVRGAEIPQSAPELERQLTEPQGAGDDAGADRLRLRSLRRMWSIGR
jgi:hypothetical protein